MSWSGGRSSIPVVLTVVASFVLILALPVLASSGESSESEPSEPPAEAVSAALDAIGAADLMDEATLFEIADLRFTPLGAVAARRFLESATPDDTPVDAIWAAIWVHALSEMDPAPLRPYVDAADPSIAVMAAVSLVALGDGAGFDRLRQGADEAEHLRGSHPPITIAEYVDGSLSRYVAAGDAPASAAGEAMVRASRWAGWLAENGARLVYDAATGTWRLP